MGDPELDYAEKLTCTPAAMNRGDVDALMGAGLSEPEILDVNQITGYFAYVNRLADGLGGAAGGLLAKWIAGRVPTGGSLARRRSIVVSSTREIRQMSLAHATTLGHAGSLAG